jgi:hypothetical protein
MFSSISDLFFDDPSQAASPYYDQVASTITPYYNPFIDAGTASLGSLQEQLRRMYEDPTSITGDIGSHYQASPGYQYNVDQATQAAMNGAAASGQAGSPAMQQALAGQISGMASQDYNQYMNQNLGLYQAGVSGLDDLTHLGYQASNELAQSLAAALMNQGNLQYAGAQSQNANTAGLFGAMGSAFGTAMPYMFAKK